MRPIKFLYCTLKKRHNWAIVTGHYLHKRGLKKLPTTFHYEFCLSCHSVKVVDGKKNENLLEKAKRNII
jgi:hypothetical protein